jgi:hypothetical protein
MAYRRSTRRKTAARSRRTGRVNRAPARRRATSRVRRGTRSGSRELRVVIEMPNVSPVARPDIAGLQAGAVAEKPKKATF